MIARGLRVAAGLLALAAGAAERPNILWLTSEDHGPQLGCYGDANARTPKIDALAAQGMRFRHVWSCAPVCAPARTTLITGQYAPSLGAEHMRSLVALPAELTLFPQLLREVGYYCANNAKEDYNVAAAGRTWDASSRQAHWRPRPAGAPFFAVFNSEASHEGQVRKRPHQAVLDPARVRVPAYHPDTPAVRQDWAQYYDQVSAADADAGRRLQELADDGLAGDTIVFYFADHGPGLPRCKRWPCDSGLRVPLVVYFPEKWKHLAPTGYTAGAVSDRLVSFVDFAPTVLSLAGVATPAWLPGRAFAGPFTADAPAFLFGFRGRMDERTDLVRTATDGRFVYVRNFMPHLSQGQHVAYQFETPTTAIWRRLFDEGKLTAEQSAFWQTPKAPEELYDLQGDPDEVHNLAGAADQQATLARFRTALRDHLVRTRDLGFLPEAELHARAGDRPPRKALAGEEAYPLARLLAAAERASNLDPAVLPHLKTDLRDPDAGIRYWAALGARMRGAPAVAGMKDDLRVAVSDPSASVRIAAAEALALFGEEGARGPALDALQAAADPTVTSAYAALAALNAIEALGPRAESIRAAVRSQPDRDPRAPARANGYVGRLRAQLPPPASP